MLREWLGSVLEGFSNLKDFMVLWFYSVVTESGWTSSL